MLERSQRRSAVRLIDDDEDVLGGEGLLARFADRALENPARSGGLLVMALTAAGIVSNAMFLQSGRHPEPLFMTRPVAADFPKTTAVPLPRVRAEPAVVAAPPADTAADAASPAPGATLIANVQRALTGAKFYSGTVDGVAGSRTRAAIAAFQKDAGLPVTGVASIDLLDRIKAPRAKAPPPAPVVAAKPPVIPVAKPAPVPVAKVVAPTDPVARIINPPAPVAKLVAPPAPVAVAKPAPVAAAPLVPVAKPVPPAPVAAASERVRAVEAALNQIGYGPLKADGAMTADTENAIRRFELDNGLAINGVADDAVVKRLVGIGAMQPI